MAANDYYTQQYNPSNVHPSTTQYQGYSDRHDAPLPIPPTSPFDDHYARPLPSPATTTASGRYPHDTDPFADNNAIPLRTKHESHQTITPMLPQDDQDDDFIRDVDPSRQQKRQHIQSQKDGWFTGKITWVVFVLTFAQLVVFIAEIARNGKLVVRFIHSLGELWLTCDRRAHKVSN